MATAKMIESWAVTEGHLIAAHNLLRPDVVEKNQAALDIFAELLEHNELREAFGFLFPIAHKAQWDSVQLLNELALAAKNMRLDKDAVFLDARIRALTLETKEARPWWKFW